MTTVAERIAEFSAKRSELAAQKDGLVQKAVIDEGRTMDEHESEQSAELASQIASIDATLKTLREHESIMKSSCVLCRARGFRVREI